MEGSLLGAIPKQDQIPAPAAAALVEICRPVR